MTQAKNQTIANVAMFGINHEKFLHSYFSKEEGAEKATKKEVKADYTIKGGGKNKVTGAETPEITGSGIKMAEKDKNGNVVRHITIAVPGADGGKKAYYNGKLFVSTSKKEAVAEGKPGAENLPDLFGAAHLSGSDTEYRLSGWMKTFQKDGKTENYVSLSLQYPFDGDAKDPEPQTSAANTNSDDIPF